MKLPKQEDKFVITDKTSPCYGNVVSGVHLEIWGNEDEDYPNKLFYYVCVKHAYTGDVISRHCGYVCACCTLKEALDYVARCLTPYQEQEEKPDEEPASGTVDNSDEGIVSERDGGNELFGSMPDDLPCEDSHGSFCPGNAARSSDDIPLGCMIPEVVAAVNHMSDSFNSLAADLLLLQHVLTPALSGTGGAAYA